MSTWTVSFGLARGPKGQTTAALLDLYEKGDDDEAQEEVDEPVFLWRARCAGRVSVQNAMAVFHALPTHKLVFTTNG